MDYFKTCSECGTALNPGEECDCRKPMDKEIARFTKLLKQLTYSELMELWEAFVAPKMGKAQF